MNSNYISGSLTQNSTETPDIVSSVSGSVVLTTDVEYCGRYFCLGNLLIQFNDSPNCIETSGSTMPTIMFPYPYDTTPYSVIINNYNKTSMTFNNSSISLGDTYDNAYLNFIAIGPRPLLLYPIVPYLTTGYVNVAYNVPITTNESTIIYQYQFSFNDPNATNNTITFYTMPTSIYITVIAGGAGGMDGQESNGQDCTLYSGYGGTGGASGIWQTQIGTANISINTPYPIIVGSGGAGNGGTSGSPSSITLDSSTIIYSAGTSSGQIFYLGGEGAVYPEQATYLVPTAGTGTPTSPTAGNAGYAGNNGYEGEGTNVYYGIAGTGGGGGLQYRNNQYGGHEQWNGAAGGGGGGGGGNGGQGGTNSNPHGFDGTTNYAVPGGGGGGGGGYISYEYANENNYTDCWPGGLGAPGTNGQVNIYCSW